MNFLVTVIHSALTALLFTFISSPSMAQVSETPVIAAKLKEIGTKADPHSIKQTLALYLPLHAADKAKDLSVTLDQSYGDHELQKLDVFSGKNAKNLPVLLFVHGGGFVAGDKGSSHNIGRWAARNGMVGVTINYQLAPKAQWPSGAKDLALSLNWVKNNIADLGGDPKQIIIAGESAGSIHTADYAFREELQNPEDGVIGVILISLPSTDLVAYPPQNEPDRNLHYYGADGNHKEQSVVNAVEGREIPILIAYSEYEPDFILDQTLRLIEAIARRDGSNSGRRMPLITSAAGHNHISITQHIGTKDTTLGPDILEFTRRLGK